MKIYMVEWGECDEHGVVGLFTTLESAKIAAELDFNRFKPERSPLRWSNPELAR